jgi:hypothetical protein
MKFIKYTALVLTMTISGSAYADACSVKLTGLFTSFQAAKICSTFGGSSSTPLTAIYGGDFISGVTGDFMMSSSGETAIPAGVSAITGTPRLYLGTPGNSIDAMAMAAWGAFANGNNIDLFKTRAASSAAPTTIVSSGDIVGNINGFGANGTSYTAATRIAMTISGTPGASNDMPGKIDFQTTPDGSGTLASVLSLDQDKSALFTGTVRSSATADIGWTRVNVANQACNTTCTSACVVGIDTLGTGGFLLCTDATADSCICAGAS